MRPLHVLWVIDHVCYDGSLHGGGRLFHNLIPAFDPGVVRIFPYFLRASPQVREVFDASPVRVTTLGRGKYDPTAFADLFRLCREHRIDVMHLFCYASSTLGRITGALNGIPALIHDFDTQIYFPYPLYLRVLDRLLAGSTAHALAASPMCKAYMRDQRGVPGDRIDVMPHAIPAERFALAARLDRAAARRELGWDARRFVFCTLTKLGPDRGNEYLLRSFARIAPRLPHARVAIVYKPTYYHRVPKAYENLPGIQDPARMRRDLDELARTLQIADRVDFVESLDEPDLYYAASDAMVVPFLDERFSSVHLLESLAHGLPAIATDLGEQAALLAGAEAGLRVAPGDEAALAAAMARLAGDETGRVAMSKAAVELANRYRVEACAERLAELYASLARRAEPGSAPS